MEFKRFLQLHKIGLLSMFPCGLIAVSHSTCTSAIVNQIVIWLGIPHKTHYIICAGVEAHLRMMQHLLLALILRALRHGLRPLGHHKLASWNVGFPDGGWCQ